MQKQLAQVNATQTKFSCKQNHQIKVKTSKGKYEAKRSKVLPIMQKARRNRQKRA